jgi:hypothetical protein
MVHQLMDKAREVILSESGSVGVRKGLPVAWIAGVCVAAAILLGSPSQAVAHCAGGGHSFPGCTSDSCRGWCIAVHACDWGTCTGPAVCVCI